MTKHIYLTIDGKEIPASIERINLYHPDDKIRLNQTDLTQWLLNIWTGSFWKCIGLVAEFDRGIGSESGKIYYFEF
jgi:hypothetical protein